MILLFHRDQGGKGSIQSGSSIVGQIRPKGRINCHRWWARTAKGRERPWGVRFIWECGKSRHLDASVEGRRRILCPVTPSGAPRLCSILSSWCPPTRRTKQNTIRALFLRLSFSISLPFFALLPHLTVVIGIRPRRGNATHFCEEESVQALTFILRLLFRPGDASGWPWNAYRPAPDERSLNCSHTILAQVA